jgi:hypothetical protein
VQKADSAPSQYDGDCSQEKMSDTAMELLLLDSPRLLLAVVIFCFLCFFVVYRW